MTVFQAFPSLHPMAWIRSACMALCLMLAACGGKVDLMGAIPEDEANEVISALLQAQIPAEKIAGKEGMVSVRVPSDHVGNSLELLREHGLPRERYAGMGQVFKKEGLISSPLEERARYIYALSQELSQTLSKIDGVLNARVHVVLPERGVAGEASVPSTAAVFIRYQDGYNLDILQPQIRRLVTNSIPSLSAENVSVILIASQQRILTETAHHADVAKVWGIPVAVHSAGALSALLWSMLLLSLAALAAAGYALWRWSPWRRKETALGTSTTANTVHAA